MNIYKRNTAESINSGIFAHSKFNSNPNNDSEDVLQVNQEVQKKIDNYIENINFLIHNTGKKSAFEMKKMAAKFLYGFKKQQALSSFKTAKYDFLDNKVCCVNIINILKALRYSYAFMWDKQTLILLGMQIRFFKSQLQGYYNQ